MPSELSRRLNEFRTKNKVVPAIQKVSFLFDPTRAAGLDVLSLGVIAKKSLFELAKLEPSLTVFEDLFDGTGKNVDFLSQDEHAELKARISQLLMFLSAHLKSLDCQQCIEYLIQRFHIHVHNGEDLILCALPYHDSAMFGSLVKLVPFFKHIEKATPSESRWTFLKNVHKSGSPLSRLALIKMCRSSQPVMTAILNYTIDSLKIGAFSQPLLAFVSTLMMTVLSEFNSIRYDISVLLFSVCRVCFKVASVCPSAYFLGLSLTTSIVCVADIRDDALGLLLSRAVSSCPLAKLRSVVLALIVVSQRRSNPLPESVITALESIDSDSLESAITELVSSQIVDTVSLKSILPSQYTPFIDRIEHAPKLIVEESTVAEQSSDASESSTSEDEEDDDEDESEIDRVRRTLTSLINKGSKRDRLDAVTKYANVDGATRYCIRLAAACNCVESLALAIKSNKSDKGYSEILKSEISNFSNSNPRIVVESAFAGDKMMVPSGSIQEVSNLLNVPDAGSIIALVKSSEKDFVLSGNVWKTIAVMSASKSASKTAIIEQWRSELVPAGFLASELPARLRELTDRFVEYANNSTVSSEPDVASALGQLACAVFIPNPQYRKPLSALAVRSFTNLSEEQKTQFVTQIIRSNCSPIIKKFCESFDNIETSVDAQNDDLVAAIDSCFSATMTKDSWTLVKLLSSMGAQITLDQLLRGLVHESSMGWNCVASWSVSAQVDSDSLQACVQIVSRILDSMDSAEESITQMHSAQIEALFGLVQNESIAASLRESDEIKSLVARVIKSAIHFNLKFASDSLSDSTVVSLQSICDSVLTLLPFTEAWTILVSTMGTICMESPADRVTVQTLCMILLSSLIGTDSVDTDTITSKELGLLLIGLVDLISDESSEIGACGSIDSWVGHSARLSTAIQQCLVQYLGNCTLKQLDKMFRKLVSQYGRIGETGLGKFSTVLSVYSQICDQGGSAVVLGVIGVVRDMILSGLGYQSTNMQSKRRRAPQLVSSALEAITHSCVEELPESYIDEFAEALATPVASATGAQDSFGNACVALANICSSDQIKKFVKGLMTQTVGAPCDVQECTLRTLLRLWKKVGEPMVPSITEVTVYIGELYRSKDESVRSAAVDLVKEIDRRTGEDIEGKLGGSTHGGNHNMDISSEDDENDE